MIMAKPSKSQSLRDKYVMFKVDDELREMLEAVRDDRSRETGETATFTLTLRNLVRAEFGRRKLKLRGGK